jgi:hypothetical protein
MAATGEDLAGGIIIFGPDRVIYCLLYYSLSYLKLLHTSQLTLLLRLDREKGALTFSKS